MSQIFQWVRSIIKRSRCGSRCGYRRDVVFIYCSIQVAILIRIFYCPKPPVMVIFPAWWLRAPILWNIIRPGVLGFGLWFLPLSGWFSGFSGSQPSNISLYLDSDEFWLEFPEALQVLELLSGLRLRVPFMEVVLIWNGNMAGSVTVPAPANAVTLHLGSWHCLG